QQMIKDSDKKLFDIVLVWKLDRFARNRYDSARYKTQLKRNGVKLVSATEVISAGPEGIILESVLEGYAEYYSADLSEKVVRGMTENALKGIYNGGTIPFGYMIDETRHYQPDPLLAPYVEQTFQKYVDGATMTDLRDWLKAHNIKNSMGGEMSYNTIQRMLSNRRYIGELRLRDVVQPNAIPALVSEELFNKVQEKLAKNKKAPARHKAEESYLLTTKLYCGKCGALMFGESGVSHTGKMYTYYKCAAAKKKKTCDKKAVRKQWLEDLVVNETMKLVEDDASMNAIIAKVMELQNQESTDLPIYEKQLKETEVGITNMLNAIQMGILTSSTKERLEALEEQRKELQARIAEERLAKPKMKEEFVRFWLLRFRKLDMTQPEQRQALVDTFINAIYLYDDKVLITFNYKEGTETVAFGEAVKAEKSSDMSARGAPDIERQIVRFDVLFCCVTPKIRGLHGQCTIFARLAFSLESSAWAGIALKCVVNFASGQQSQTELRLYFGVSVLQKFQQSSHRDGRFAFGGYSLRAGAFLFGVETFLKLPAQFHTRGLLDMGVGVYQHICRGVSGSSLNSFHIAAGDHQLRQDPRRLRGLPQGRVLQEISCRA
ncbi:MAG: recombinase family protein, partial [Escherichia coli]|nr:recombinase family protein [Escherichia coli]